MRKENEKKIDLIVSTALLVDKDTVLKNLCSIFSRVDICMKKSRKKETYPTRMISKFCEEEKIIECKATNIGVWVETATSTNFFYMEKEVKKETDKTE